ncbi:MAG: hypothetical protein K8S97_08645 [Anaerolineae bacterium]|nr:hypothetical protein [Anaerolineae bacterium]
MITIRERLEAFWSGERPSAIPFTTYESIIPSDWRDPVIQQMFADGLGVLRSVPNWDAVYHNVDVTDDTTTIDGQTQRRQVWRTPVGDVDARWVDHWQEKHVLETAADYRVMTYIVEHTEYVPAYETFATQTASAPAHVIVAPRMGRTPLQTILVDYAGLANFALHLYEYEAELRALYEALRVKYRELAGIVAAGPGRYVSVMENFSAETLGPRRYADFLLPVYEETCGLFRDAGKVVGYHYDGKLASVKDLVARAPLDLIESFTPPPEGDMTMAEARAAWPDKLLWAHINLGCYELPPDELREEIWRRVAAGAPDGRRLAFEVSEDRPPRWRESMPVILAALNDYTP